MNRGWTRLSPTGKPLVLDAAIGTRLIQRGLNLADNSPALWVVSHPEEILDLHRRDIAAGADAILTATFGASPTELARLGHPGELAAIHRTAVELARQAADSGQLVIGSIGPGTIAAMREQFDHFVDEQVDAIVFETVRANTALLILNQVRSLADLPVVVSLFDPGVDWVEVAPRLIDSGADVLGTNCQATLEMATRETELLTKALREFCTQTAWLKPGGGLPGEPPISPEHFATQIPNWLELGAGFIGGCCGTTEEHVRAIRQQIDRSFSPQAAMPKDDRGARSERFQ